MQLHDEAIVLIKTQEMDIIAQKQSFKNIVAIVRSYSTTPFCKFIFVNYLVDKFKEDGYIKCLFGNHKTRYAGRLLLWAVCEILNDTYMPHSKDSATFPNLRTVKLLQYTFIAIRCQTKLPIFGEFVAIRQHLGRGVHCALDLIDSHALKVNGQPNWENAITNYPAKSLEDFYSSPLRPLQNIDIGAAKSRVKVPVACNITHPKIKKTDSGTKAGPASISLNSNEKQHQQVSLPVTTKTTISTWEPLFSPELDYEKETAELELLEKANIRRKGYKTKRDQTSVPAGIRSDIDEFVKSCRAEFLDSIRDQNMKACQNRSELVKPAKQIRDSGQNDQHLCLQTIGNTGKKRPTFTVKAEPKITDFHSQKEGYNKNCAHISVQVETKLDLKDFRKSESVLKKEDLIRDENKKAYQQEATLFQPDDTVKHIRGSGKNDEIAWVIDNIDKNDYSKKGDHTLVVLITDRDGNIKWKPGQEEKKDSIHNEKIKATENEVGFTIKVDGGEQNEERKQNDAEESVLKRTVNRSTNVVPCTVKIAPKVAGFDSIYLKPKPRHLQSNQTNRSSTVNSNSFKKSSKTTNNLESTENKGGSWTASILPTNHKRQSGLNQGSGTNNDSSSSKISKHSKHEELKFEAITSLSCEASIREKQRTMILLKEDFTAEEYFNYLCSPLLKSFNLVKMYGKYRIKIVLHPVVNPSDS